MKHKESGKGLFGSGYLISYRKKAEREKAEREKSQVWKLSKREIEIIKSLKQYNYIIARWEQFTGKKAEKLNQEK